MTGWGGALVVAPNCAMAARRWQCDTGAILLATFLTGKGGTLIVARVGAKAARERQCNSRGNDGATKVNRRRCVAVRGSMLVVPKPGWGGELVVAPNGAIARKRQRHPRSDAGAAWGCASKRNVRASGQAVATPRAVAGGPK